MDHEEETQKKIMEIHNSVHAKFGPIHPIRLIKNERKIVDLLDNITAVKQELETSRKFDNQTKILCETAQRDIEYLQVQLAFNSHNFLLFSAGVSLFLGFISLVLGIISIILGIISII